LFLIKHKTKIVDEISKENKIPLSTTCKKLNKLDDLALAEIEKRVFSDRTGIVKYYKGRIDEAQISIKKLKSIIHYVEINIIFQIF